VALKEVEAAKEEGQSKEHIIDLLTKEELAKFGNRVPNGFKKLGILGRGTTTMIWLAENQMTGETVALKQYPKNDRGQVDERTKMELSFYEQIFDESATKNADGSASAGQPASLKDQGIRYILKLYEHFDEYKDLWLCYEVGKRPLAERLCTYKELQYKGETIYNMKH
jgi:serine/threonine protein kinase